MSNSKSKKSKKQKKPFRIPPDLILGLKTIFSNDAVIKASREMKGWKNIIPIALALGSVVLAVLPTYVNQNNVQGSSAVFTSPTANYEAGLASFLHSIVYDADGNLRAEPVQIKISDEGSFSITEGDLKALCDSEDAKTWYTVNRSSTDLPYFEVFFNTTSSTDEEFFNFIDSNQNPYTGSARPIHYGETITFQASYLAFGKTSVRVRKRTSNVVGTGLTGLYDHLQGTSITDFALQLYEEGLSYTSLEYAKKTTDFFKEFINNSYLGSKIRNLWMYVGIFAGVDAAAVIVFGLILFLMTRGKRNPCRIYTFWETEKMACWSAFTPAVLSLFGFLIPSMGFIFFFMLYGFRMMWMSMKSMRPTAS